MNRQSMNRLIQIINAQGSISTLFHLSVQKDLNLEIKKAKQTNTLGTLTESLKNNWFKSVSSNWTSELTLCLLCVW